MDEAERGRTVVACEVCGEDVPMRIGQSSPGAKPAHPRCRRELDSGN